ncbi:MAG: peptidylprolyl isomerase [Tissierellia bacterium]|nr:peptidylprolyl isomerase [Tissierellia bacterium]
MGKDKVLATVNNKDITEQDVHVFLNQLDPQTAGQFRTPEGINKIANELINQELLYLEALENELDKEEGFIAELEKIKMATLKQYAINKLFSNIVVSEEEVNNFYDENKQHFQKPESARASHILVDTKGKANRILDEIDNGLSFEEAASKYSNCPSKDKGGDLGEFQRGRMVPEFEEAAFSMDEDELSKPVKTQFGYHLIKLKHRKGPETSSLVEVRDQINNQLILMKQQERYLDRTEKLKKEYEVKTYF